MERKIRILSLFIVISALVTKLSYIYTDYAPVAVDIIRYLLNFMDFGYMDRGDFIKEYYSALNFIEIFMFLFFLCGALLFASNPKQSRIVRFMYSLMLLNKVFGIFAITTNIILDPKEYIQWWFVAIAYVWAFLQIFVSWKVLKWFDSQRELQIATAETSSGTMDVLVEATRWRRFVNVNIDDIIFTLILTPTLCYRLSISTIEGTSYGNPKLSLLIRIQIFMLLLMVLRWCYYFFFENFLQSTPGKILTQTCVTNSNGEKPTTGQIMRRTFSRFVPFNALSFLGRQGWHDKWSETYVIKENRGARGGSVYYLAIPAFVLVWIAGYFIKPWADQRKKDAQMERVFNQVRQKNDKVLESLNYNDALVFMNVRDSADILYLKPTDIKRDKITFSKTVGQKSGNSYDELHFCANEIEERFRAGYPETVILTPKLLHDANIAFDSTPKRNNGQYTQGISLGSGKYVMVSTANLNGPDITNESQKYAAFTLQDKTEINIVNTGRTVRVVKIINDTGDGIVWKASENELTGTCNTYTTYKIYSDKPFRDEVALTLVVEDASGNTFRYKMYGDLSNAFESEVTILRTK